MSTLYAFELTSINSELSDAIAILGEFPQAVVHLIAPLANIRFGPYSASWSCCTSSFLGICLQTSHYSIGVDFGDAQTGLGGALQTIQADSHALLQQLDPLQQWMAVTVPATSQEFQAASGPITAAEHAGSNVTPIQRQAVLASLQALATILQNGAGQVNVLTGAFATSLQSTTRAAAAVDAANQAMESSIQNGINTAQDDVRSHPCGGDTDSQFATIKLAFSINATAASGAIRSLKDLTTTANNAIGVLVGTLAGFATSYTSALQQLNQAQDEEFNVALQALHFDVSWDTWKALAANVAPHAQSMMRIAQPPAM